MRANYIFDHSLSNIHPQREKFRKQSQKMRDYLRCLFEITNRKLRAFEKQKKIKNLF